MHNRNNSRLDLKLSDENATLSLAHRITAQLQPGMVIHLHGDLGAGKTTFVRGVLNSLGYSGRVKSPTYTLVEPYHIAGLNLLHFDLYRLQNEQEWESAGFRDEYDGEKIFFIEWAEKGGNSIPQADIEIHINILPSYRKVELHANTTTGERCLGQL